MIRHHTFWTLIALAAYTQLSTNDVQSKRGMTVEDVLSIENLGDIALSPDGQWAALVIQRSKLNAGFHCRTRLGGDDRADIWLVSTATGARERMTDGTRDGSGYWAPSWSADGERLAMLSSQGGDNAHLFVWSRGSRVLERVANEGIHIGATVAVGDAKGYGYMWIDKTTVLAVVVPSDFQPFDFGGDHETQTVAPREWKKMELGREPSVSVLTSGEGAESKTTVARVVTIDVAKCQTTHEADVAVAMLSAPQVSYSPDGRHIAVFETAPCSSPAEGKQMTFAERGKTRVGIVKIGSDPSDVKWVEAIENPSLDTVFWSPDGSSLAALAPKPAAALTLGANRISLAVIEGELWQLDDRRPLRNLTSAFEPKIRALSTRQGVHGSDVLEVIVTAGEVLKTTYYRVAFDILNDKSPVEITEVKRPSESATVEAHWPQQHTVVFKATEDHGVFAWATNLSTGRTTRLAAINEHLADVAPAKKMLIEYRGVDGDILKGVVLLPFNYEEGQRYPVLTWVYAGTVFGDIGKQTLLTSKFSDNSLNMLPLLAHGYVVLLPSMPLAAEGKPSDPMIDLPKGVIAAVDRLIDLGIADPERLAVGGHSYGGYSTYCIVTQTNRFKAAISAAGVSNLVSAFGTFDARFRYDDRANEGVSQMRWAEGGQGRMGTPPYEDIWRYVRNSPVNYVDRVQTPLLIIQGDIDFVPISQGEEFFSGLHRQGKKARFLRYWGEGHSVESPANIRNMWQEIFSWLDSHLAPAKK